MKIQTVAWWDMNSPQSFFSVPTAVLDAAHQLCVHLQFLRYPIVNDPVYARVWIWVTLLFEWLSISHLTSNQKGGINVNPRTNRELEAAKNYRMSRLFFAVDDGDASPFVLHSPDSELLSDFGLRSWCRDVFDKATMFRGDVKIGKEHKTVKSFDDVIL
jgi:hypothetical protein